MKKYKIFCLCSHTSIERVSGVDYVRITQPMTHFGKSQNKYQVTVYDPKTGGSFDWRDIFRDYDAVYFNYTSNDIGYAIMGCLAQKYDRKLICDFDDDLWNILQDNTAFDLFKEGSWGRTVVTAIAGDVYHATTTNEHLRHSILYNTKQKNITTLPNYIDLSLYKYRCKFKDRGYYRALHFGSSTHFSSLYNDEFYRAMDRIMKEYPNFSFESVGAFAPKYRERWGARYKQSYGDIDLLKWIKKMPKFMDETDFVVVPLNNNTYNRSKSCIKFLETSSYKIPGIWQDIRQYQEVVKHGVNGYLCKEEQGWYEAIKGMLDNASQRRKMGEEAFKTIQKWTIQNNTQKYTDMFNNLLDK